MLLKRNTFAQKIIWNNKDIRIDNKSFFSFIKPTVLMGLYTLMICYLILTRSGRVIFINEKV